MFLCCFVSQCGRFGLFVALLVVVLRLFLVILGGQLSALLQDLVLAAEEAA